MTDRRAKIEAELAKGWEYAAKFQELRARLDALNASMRIEGPITKAQSSLKKNEISEGPLSQSDASKRMARAFAQKSCEQY